MLLPKGEPIYPVYKDDTENLNKIKKEENAKVVNREITEEEVHEYILLAVEEKRKE